MARTHITTLFKCETLVMVMSGASSRDKMYGKYIAKRNLRLTPHTGTVAEREL